VADGPPEVPSADRAIGLGFYISQSAGVAGRIKATPEEFRVREVSNYPRPDPAGPYTILRVESRGWEQHELADAIGRRLGLARRAIAWSGTKDRQAVSERLFAYRGPPPSVPLELDGVVLLDAYPARDGLVLGQHYANAFEIRVSGLDAPDRAVDAYRAVERELRAAGGFPNFFGPQRFGEVRPITHEVGRALVRGDLAAAVDIYLVGRPATGAAGVGDDARAAFAEHRDAARALREFPPGYRFERSILERMARGYPPEKAFRALPFELRRLFVHAYQSYLFNRYLSARQAAQLPLNEPLPGDWVVRIGRDGSMRSRDAVAVDADNRAECAELVGRGRAFVAGPLLGSGAFPTEGEPGRLVAEVAAAEEITARSFDIPVAPELASDGAWRALLLPVPPLGLRPDADGVWFSFALPKGAYATVLLREFLKANVAA
jgi:tRNA pseudouridine13 synthase